MSEQPTKRARGITSEQAKTTWENPEIRAKRIEAMKVAGLERRKKNGHAEIKATTDPIPAEQSQTPINAQVESTPQ